MKSLFFTDYELQELKNFYEHQIQKMRERMEHIQSILEKVSSEAFAAAEALLESAPKKRGRKPASSKSVGKTSGALSAEQILEKAGLRATKWNKFIINTLQNLNRPLTIQELAELAAKEFKFPLSELEKVRLTINQALIRIRKTNVVKQYKIKGLKNKYFGLEAWFHGDKLLDDFQKLIGGGSPAEKAASPRGRKAKEAAKAEAATSTKGKGRRGRKKGSEVKAETTEKAKTRDKKKSKASTATKTRAEKKAKSAAKPKKSRKAAERKNEKIEAPETPAPTTTPSASASSQETSATT
ncbi:MAG: DUF4777 domain-containing protein [Flavobacteriales bacterium]|nr:DUF4777 domain-containing protein [Flavobacteriales bacterium]